MSPKFDKTGWTDLANNRKMPRNAVAITAELRMSVGQKFRVSILDLSQTGFRLETGNYIAVGSRVYLAIPELSSLPARIAWNEGNYYGCAFLHPLHQSVFEHFALKYPSLTA